MKTLSAVTLVLLSTVTAAAQELVVRRGYAPELPAAGKWIGTKLPLRLDDMKGKVVIVHFWRVDDASEQNSRLFEEWTNRFGKKFAVVGIHSPDPVALPEPADIEKRANRFAKSFPSVIDETDLAQKAWKVENVPIMFLIDKKGTLRYSWEGQIVYKRIRGDLIIDKRIEELLREK